MVGIIVISIIGCSKTIGIKEVEDSPTYQLRFENQSYGCATAEIRNLAGSLVSVQTGHGSIGTGTFSTTDSVLNVKVTSLPNFGGVMFSVTDSSYNFLGSKEQSGVTNASIPVRAPADGVIRVYLRFYNPCPIPDEPGCPVEPSIPYPCP